MVDLKLKLSLIKKEKLRGNGLVKKKVHLDYGNVWKLKLHGNTIATIDEMNMLSISNAGWESNTTKERLNGLPNVRINQKKFQWYLNGNEWNGEWTRIGTI